MWAQTKDIIWECFLVRYTLSIRASCCYHSLLLIALSFNIFVCVYTGQHGGRTNRRIQQQQNGIESDDEEDDGGGSNGEDEEIEAAYAKLQADRLAEGQGKVCFLLNLFFYY